MAISEGLVLHVLTYLPTDDVIRVRAVGRVFRRKAAYLLTLSIRSVLRIIAAKDHEATLETACQLAESYARYLGPQLTVEEALHLIIRPLPKLCDHLLDSALNMVHTYECKFVARALRVLSVLTALVDAQRIPSIWHATLEVIARDDGQDHHRALTALVSHCAFDHSWDALCDGLEREYEAPYRGQSSFCDNLITQKALQQLLHLLEWATTTQKTRFVRLIINVFAHTLKDGYAASQCADALVQLSPNLEPAHKADLVSIVQARLCMDEWEFQDAFTSTFPALAPLLPTSSVLPLWNTIATTCTHFHLYKMMLSPLVPLLPHNDLPEAWSKLFERICALCSLDNGSNVDCCQSPPRLHPLVVILCEDLAPRLPKTMLASICSRVSMECTSAAGIIAVGSLLTSDQVSSAVAICVKNADVHVGLSGLVTLAPKLSARELETAIAYALDHALPTVGNINGIHYTRLYLLTALANSVSASQAEATVQLAMLVKATEPTSFVTVTVIAAVAPALTPSRVREMWSLFMREATARGPRPRPSRNTIALEALAQHLIPADVHSLMDANLPDRGVASPLQQVALEYLVPYVVGEASLNAVLRVASEAVRAHSPPSPRSLSLLWAVAQRLSDSQLLLAWRVQLTNACYSLKKWADLFRKRPDGLRAAWCIALDLIAEGGLRSEHESLCALGPPPSSVQSQGIARAWPRLLKLPGLDTAVLSMVTVALCDADVDSAFCVAVAGLSDDGKCQRRCLDAILALAPRLSGASAVSAMEATLTFVTRVSGSLDCSENLGQCWTGILSALAPSLTERQCAFCFQRVASLTEECDSTVAELLRLLHRRMSLVAAAGDAYPHVR